LGLPICPPGLLAFGLAPGSTPGQCIYFCPLWPGCFRIAGCYAIPRSYTCTRCEHVLCPLVRPLRPSCFVPNRLLLTAERIGPNTQSMTHALPRPAIAEPTAPGGTEPAALGRRVSGYMLASITAGRSRTITPFIVVVVCRRPLLVPPALVVLDLLEDAVQAVHGRISTLPRAGCKARA
jgi:hypothetical protein